MPMPARAKRPCRHKGCAAITNDVSGYCDQHRKQHAGDGWRNYQSGKSRKERGYGRLWEIKRARKSGNEKGSDKPDTPWTGEGGDTGKGKKAKVNQYEQLRREIEAAHASSLGRINLQEQESARKLLKAARADGASEADIQKTLLLNAENYQKQRLELAEQYAPARATLTKEREASQELKSLLNARLLDEKEYQTARITLAQSTVRELLQAQAAAMSAPLRSGYLLRLC